MSLNFHVYSHPINAFIIRNLEMTVDDFCILYGFKQGTVASWISRDRSVENLPVSFIYELSLAACKNMSEVYLDLLELEEDYVGRKKMKGI